MDVNEDVKQSLLLEIDRYLRSGMELFPLLPGKKEPLHEGWRDRDYPRQRLRNLVKNLGCNIAWKIGPLDLVVDIDPRHAEATEAEKKLTGLSNCVGLADVWPSVDTGGTDGGRHYYLRLPKKVKLKSKTPEFPDIHFQRIGQYVLIAGCLHRGYPNSYPGGKQYERNPFSPAKAPLIPPYLLEALQVPEQDRSAIDPDSASLSLEEISAYLMAIKPQDHRDYPDWLAIGMSVHAASGGSYEAQELWVDWSTSDPMYADAEEINRLKWASFRTGRAESVTAATLVRAAMDSGSSPNTTTPQQDFGGVPIEMAPSMMPLPQWMALLSDTDNRPKLLDAIEQSARYDWDHWDEIRLEISRAYHARLVTVDKLKTKIAADKKLAKQQEQRRSASADPVVMVVEALLDDSFESGRHLVHAPNQMFYDFLGTHWAELKKNVVHGLVLAKAEALAAEPDQEVTFKSSSMLRLAPLVLEARAVKKEDVFGFAKSPPAVVNTANCEVWMTDDGQIKPRPHRPESYLLSCLATRYDPHAKCLIMDKTLREIFAKNRDPEEMIRHFWEFAGYVLQPRKDIPIWAMWHGRGSNGKSILMHILSSLLGPAVLPRPVADFADNGRNNHALASLVGKLLLVDDDASVDRALPESALKKLAENNLLESNPKGRDAFTFRHSVTALVLINDWPRIRDLSHGMIRKSYVFPFRRVLHESEYDLSRERTIIGTESPGVLNRALEGYKRLRTRGHFADPEECVDAKKEWLRAANPIIDFLSCQISMTKNGAFVPVEDLFMAYRLWCQDIGGVRSPLARHRFELSLLQLGHRLDTRGGRQALLGARMRGDFE